MMKSQATAEVFYEAFKALPRKERDRVLLKIVKNKTLREDLMDLAVAEARRKEKGRPLREVLAELDRERA